jgi:hypothetical protein
VNDDEAGATTTSCRRGNARSQMPSDEPSPSREWFDGKSEPIVLMRLTRSFSASVGSSEALARWSLQSLSNHELVRAQRGSRASPRRKQQPAYSKAGVI